jgi:hypothetical protein
MVPATSVPAFLGVGIVLGEKGKGAIWSCAVESVLNAEKTQSHLH